MGSLEAHKARINQYIEKNEEKAFQVKDSTIKYGKIIMIQQIEVVEEEDFAVVEVMVMEEVEEEIMGTCSPMSKATQKMVFNFIIATAMGT
ncbi:hypothetical protein KY289_026583 [Solanum tuberosum]|nr:hypothetical protein KY289_026583 [Solanum tuberosum]